MAKRELHPKMYELIMHKLERNGAAQTNMHYKKDPRRLLIYAAEPFVGTREKTGDNDGPVIELIQETIGSAVREPYCAAFVQTMIAFVEKVYDIKSPVFPTEHVMTMFRETDKKQRVLHYPNPGAILIYNHHGTDSGHTGLYVEPLSDVGSKYMHCIEANTTSGLDPDGEIVREGGGIYWTKRPWAKNVGNMFFLGWLKPF